MLVRCLDIQKVGEIMCGIFGALFQDGTQPDEQKLKTSIELLRHRGPDARVVHSEPGLGLAHARLSLVDVSTRSNQPFWDKTRRYVLVFNGEIYNFRELRAELEARGQVFETSSDTEVLLYMLVHHGAADTLPRLKGMFAFAFIDRQDRTAVLARDRYGKKPLFYASTAAGFYFASEVKALRPWLDLTPNAGSVAAYLMQFGGPTKGHSFYEGVEALAPGHMLELSEAGTPTISPFFQVHDYLDPAENARMRDLTAEQLADEFEQLMGASVDSHAFADANVGAFCSGGVDSSLIISMAARKTPNLALFHANVKGHWSEIDPARALAKHLKLDIHSVDIEEQDFVDTIPKVIRHYEYPFTYHPNCAPLMMIAGLARDTGVKGLLSGEGSDELFLGYPWLGRKQLTDTYEGMTKGMANLVRSIPKVGHILLPDRIGNYPAVKDIMNGMEMLDDYLDVSEAVDAHTFARSDPTVRWTLDYMNHHLRTLLLRNDTMGMASSIEARFPFLDNDLAKFGANLPGKHKLKFSPFVFEKAHPFIRDKWIVRTVADRYIPKKLSQRIKVGFWTTVFQRLEIKDEFFRSPALGDVLKLSSRQMLRLTGEASNDLRLRLLHLDIWVRTCILDEPDEVSVARLRDMVSIRDERLGPIPTRRSNATRHAASAPV